MSFVTTLVVAVVTIAVSAIIFHKLRNKFQDKTIHVSKQNPQPQSIEVSEKGNTNLQPQFIDKAKGEHNLDTSIPASDSAGDEADKDQLGTLITPLQSPSVPLKDREVQDTRSPQKITSELQSIDTSNPAHTYTTPEPQRDTKDEEPLFTTCSQESSSFQISESNAAIILNGDGQFTKMQRSLICDYIAGHDILSPDTNKDHYVLARSIMALPRANAVFTAYRNKMKDKPCFKGTRVALLQEMADYVTGPSEFKVYVLSGLAEAGKTTVAYTIASRAASLNLLGASFFFSQDESDRNTAQKFFTTIAYQLCLYNEAFSEAIGGALKTERGSAVTTEDPQDQLQTLILDPLRSIVQSRCRPILIVVDGLDEYNEADACSVLTGLSQLVQDLPSFKVILTTRPLPFLNHFLDNKRIFHLQNIEDKVVDSDIPFYLNRCLSINGIQKSYPQYQWHASDKEIDFLAHITGRSFIIASTAVRYIFDTIASYPAAQIQKLRYASAQNHIPFTEPHQFYTIILQDVIPANCDNNTIKRYQSIVGAIILVERPLPVSILARILDIDVDDIRVVLDKLQSLILLDSDDVPHICHKSFSDYLRRCEAARLRIDSRINHTQIATQCFEIMGKHLKYNILGLGDSARFINNEDALKEDGITHEKLEEYIPQQLRYACIYWANHSAAANVEDAEFMNGLAKFANEHILHWFEVLSLIGKLELARRAILIVLKLLKSTPSDLRQLLSDALRFFLKFSGIIKQSALHTYYTGLCFTPSDTLFYRQYNKEAKYNMCSIEGEPKNWDPLFTVLTHGPRLEVIKFSANNALISSFPGDFQDGDTQQPGKLKIWDAAAGTLLSTIPGHRFAVANDFSTASFKDNVITCYDVNGLNGSVNTPRKLFTTSSKIERLAFSCESSRIAVGLSDESVLLLLNSSNGKLVGRFDGFGPRPRGTTRFWHQLQFSPDGTRLAYSSADGVVKVRDGIDGRFIGDLRCGEPIIAISGDSTRIASFSMKTKKSKRSKLSLWNGKSCALIGDYFLNINLNRLAISKNGSHIAADNSNKVTLWNTNRNGSLTQVDVLNLGPHIYSFTFSPDDIFAIATRDSIMLYNVTTLNPISLLPLDGQPRSLAFSPDSTRLAVATGEGRIYLWDVRDINTFAPLLKKEGNAETVLVRVTVLVLSQDCSRLVCGFSDGTIQLWTTTSSTKHQVASHRAHTSRVAALGFSPDGGVFASGSDDGIIKLWNSGDGGLRGTLNAVVEVLGLALSNSVLVAAVSQPKYLGSQRSSYISQWSLDTQELIQNFEISLTEWHPSSVSIAGNNTLIAVMSPGYATSKPPFYFTLRDAVKHRTIIHKTDIPSDIHTMTFLPDNLELVLQLFDGTFLSFNLTNKHVTKGAILERLIHLPISFWHDVPIWHCHDGEQHYFSALFSQDKSPMPVLWIPQHLFLKSWVQGSSMIVLSCGDGRVIHLRLPTNHVN